MEPAACPQRAFTQVPTADAAWKAGNALAHRLHHADGVLPEIVTMKSPGAWVVGQEFDLQRFAG